MKRADEFAHVVAATVSYLKGQWPQELKTLRVDVVGMPHDLDSTKV